MRRHEIEMVCEPSRVRNKRIYTEKEMDQQYPENESIKNRYKRLQKCLYLPKMQLYDSKEYISVRTDKLESSQIPAKLKRRRDTVEKNLDEMFSSDQETDDKIKEPERKKQKINEGAKCHEDNDNNVTPLIPDPFYGFRENETCLKKQNIDIKYLEMENKGHFPTLSKIPLFATSFLQVDSNGNTFGMSSVLASPISDFNSEYDGEEVCETTQKNMSNNAHK